MYLAVCGLFSGKAPAVSGWVGGTVFLSLPSVSVPVCRHPLLPSVLRWGTQGPEVGKDLTTSWLREAHPHPASVHSSDRPKSKSESGKLSLEEREREREGGGEAGGEEGRGSPRAPGVGKGGGGEGRDKDRTRREMRHVCDRL